MQRALSIPLCLSALLVASLPLHAAAGGDGSNGSDVALASAAFLARPPASVDLAAEATNATVPGFEESLEHVERNQSENVLVEGNPWITLIGCKEQGGDCSGGQSCCDGLECQNVNMGSEILTTMSCQPQCKYEGMVC